MEGDTGQSSANEKDGSKVTATSNQDGGKGSGENSANGEPGEESPSVANGGSEEKEKSSDNNVENNSVENDDVNDSDNGIELKISAKQMESDAAEDKEETENKTENDSQCSNTVDKNGVEANFNENRCSADEGGGSGRYHNGRILEHATKKKSKSVTKALPKKVSITEVALFNMPDFPDSDTRLPQKAEEQLRTMTRSKDNKHLKQWLRTHNWPVGHPIRTILWRHICKYMFKPSGNIYQEMVDDLFKDELPEVLPLPGFVDPEHVPVYYLTQTGVYSVHMILIVLEQLNPDVTFCPSLFPLTAMFLHFMEPSDCFNCLYAMLRTTESQYMAQTNTAVDATHLVMRDLAKHHAKSAFSSVFKDTDGNVEPVFRNWIWWIFSDLPFPILVQVLDCYLFEGVKVLYRVGLAILILYHKHCIKLHGPHSPLVGANVTARLKHFCEEMPYSVEKIFKTAFGIRGLGRKELRKLQLRHEMYEKSQTIKMTRASSFARPTSRASFSGPSTVYARSYSIPAPINSHKHARTKGDTMSHDLTDLELESSSSEAVVPKQRARSLTCLNLDEVHCHTLKHRDLLTLWAWIPSRFTISQPHLLYTTEEHGISLRTLYSRIGHNEPTLFVIKTTRNEVFGAFCSTDWRERVQKGQSKNLSYFGTGETFVFSLFPKKKVYHWVGLNQSDVPATANMFLAGDHHALDIGGGNGIAIHLDEGLVHCRTEKCDTFNNEPLCPSKDFSCKVLEVFGFR